MFKVLFKRELQAYFQSPVAYVFLVIFLLASVGCTFFLGSFFDANQASLTAFFTYLPWLFMILVPAIGMRLWAEEYSKGTIELLFSLPVEMYEVVLAKFLAAWVFLGGALLLTFPMIITVNYLGEPDNGVLFCGYLASFLMAGAYLALSCFMSSLTKNQIISFVLSVLMSFIFVLLGWGVFHGILGQFFPTRLVDFLSYLGFIEHFNTMVKGLIDTRDFIYFLLFIGLFLGLNVLAVETIGGRKA